jgi:hypothetical protein
MGAPAASAAQGAAPIQIPGVILEFLNRATVAVVGTRDAHRVPHVHRVSGWRVEPGREVIACSIPAAFTRHLMESLEDNGQVSMTVEEVGPHETYQFKGVFEDAQPSTTADRQAADHVRERFGRVVPPWLGVTEAASLAFGMPPQVTVRFRVQEIYVQTPGPGAGRRLVPREEQ